LRKLPYAQGAKRPSSRQKAVGGDVIKRRDFTAVVPNITPDNETGIGRWTDEELILAIREGGRPDGRLLGPAMPSRLYRSLADDDVRAIAALLARGHSGEQSNHCEVALRFAAAEFLGAAGRGSCRSIEIGHDRL
jgi:hypothetical protein